MLVLGIDGGGTTSEVVLGSPEGSVIARVATASSNVRTHGPAQAISVVGRAIDDALFEAHAGTGDIGAVCAGLAGISRSAEREPVEQWLQTWFSGRPVRLLTDVELVLAAGTSAETGLAIVSGTGSVAFGRDARGRTRRAGGRGASLGDPGSGYAIGRAALSAVADAFDEMTADGLLTQAVRGLWPELSDADFDLSDRSPADIAALAETVAEVAERGDELAIAILDGAGMNLARQGAAVLRGLEWVEGPISVALAGGVLVHVSRVRAALISELDRTGFETSAKVVDEPVVGAVRLAAQLLTPAVVQP